MKNPTRTLPSLTKPKPAMPTQPNEWNQLLRKTIERADLLVDRRVAGLRQAMMDGRSESILRMMGILSDVDLDREMPLPLGR